MKAVRYSEFGSPDVVRLEEVERPVPGEDEVLVRIHAAAANPLDWRFLRGSPWVVRMMAGPWNPRDPRLGMDLAGRVEEVGSAVKQFEPGEAVFGTARGAFAEFVCASSDDLALMPAGVPFAHAATVGTAGLTALQGLRDHGRLAAGQRVLINGASGGVGTFAVQVAKWLGAEVTGVCSGRNADLVRSIGADRVVDYASEDFTRTGGRYDLILDMVGNHSLAELRRALATKGRLVLVGGTLKGMVGTVLLSPLVSQDLGFMIAKIVKDDLHILGKLLEAGTVTPVIDRTYPLDEVAAALRYLEEGHARGKVAIEVS